VRGELVMHGYWRNQEGDRPRCSRTAGSTPAISAISTKPDGSRSTDRQEDLIVNDKWATMSRPQKRRGMLTIQAGNICRDDHGDKRPYMVGLIVSPDPEWALECRANRAVKYDFIKLQADRRSRRRCREAIDRVNASLSVIEKSPPLSNLPTKPFAIDNEETDPEALKIRRHVIRERYQERYMGWCIRSEVWCGRKGQLLMD